MYKKLHPKYNYHTKVHDTDHYISEDPEFAKKPLSSWGFIDRDQKTGSGSVTLELVDNSVLDGDKYIGSQIARITGSEYNWSSFNDEAYLFSQMLFKATPHINREYPITKVAFTNAAFPSHLATTFDVVVYPPQLPQVSKEEGEEGSAKAAKKEENEPQGPVTCLCTTETVAQKLFCDALAKLNVSMAPSSVAFKCVGLELYLLPSETAPVANCTYVRNRLRRKKEVSFVVVPINELVLESPLDIKFEKFAVPKPDKSTVFSSITVQHRLEINVRSASNIVLNQVNGMTPRLFVEAAIYYGGQKISKSTCTPLEKLVTEPTATTTATTDGSNVVGNHTWDTWIGFDLTISQLPRESRVCLTLYSTHGESSEQQQQQQQQQQLQQQAQLQSQDKDQAGGEQGQSKDDQLQQEQLQQQQQQQLLSQKQQQQQYDVDLSTQALELLEDSQKEAIAWTSFRIFDHRSRLISGTHSLQLLKGKANPIGICVHAMNLHNSAYLKLTFPSGPVIVYPQDEDFPQQQQSGADAAGKRQPSKGEEAILDQIINADSLSTLSDSDKSLLWQYRHTLKSKPCSIMKLLLSTPWTDYKAVSEVHR